MLQWVKGVVFYLILLTVVSHLLPGHRYDKYIRLFTGMLLIVIVIRPVTHLFSWDVLFDSHYFSAVKEEIGNEIDEEFMEELEDVQTEQLCQEYKKQTREVIEAEAEKLGLYVTECDVQTAWKENTIVIEALNIRVQSAQTQQKETSTPASIAQVTVAEIVFEQPEYTDSSCEQLQQVLSKYYELEKEQIQIRRQE